MAHKIFSKESVLSIMAEAANSGNAGSFPITSCHSTIGYWIGNEDRLEDTDEIVLVGPDENADIIYHSILMRGNEIIGDTERASPQRGIDSRYDSETGEYTTKMFPTSHFEVTYQTIMRMTVADFKAQYLDIGGPDAEEDQPEPP